MSRQHLQTILRHAEALAFDRSAASDADLLGQFLIQRDDRAFAMLVRRHGAMVWNVCRNLLPGDADAEDAFQATFLALVRGGKRIRKCERLSAWLHGVAFRVAMKVRRTAAKRRQRETTAATAEATAPVSEAAWNDLLTAVHEEVERLPEGLRAAFVLCCLEGVRQHDAATQLGLKPNTLTTRLARARQRVIDNLTRRGIAPAAAAGAVGMGAATGTATVPLVLAEQTITFAHTLETISPTVLQLAQGAFDMTTRTKWLAAAMLVAAAMTTTVSTVFFSDATGQAPGGAGGGPNRAGGRGGATGSAGGSGAMSSFAGMMAVRWEYKVTRLTPVDGDAEKELNKLGEDGWELVTASGKPDGVAVVLKRQKSRTPAGGFSTGGGFGGAGAFGGAGGLPPVLEGTSDLPAAGAGGGAGLPGGKAADAKEPGAHVIPLKHAQAAQLQETLSPLLNAESYPVRGGFSGSMLGSGSGGGGPRIAVGNRVKIAADSRTNSLIVITDDANLKTIKELLEKLDVPEKESKTTAKP